MERRTWLADHFERQRPRLRTVAYRVLGSAADADDAVQEAWIRLQRNDSPDIANLDGWLTTVVARISLNTLRRRQTRREVHLPDPVIVPVDQLDPADAASFGDSVSLALLIVLDRLTPAERVAFVLHDAFAVPFDEIARMLGRSNAAARQHASRARRHVQGVAEPDSSLAAQRTVATRSSPRLAPETSTV